MILVPVYVSWIVWLAQSVNLARCNAFCGSLPCIIADYLFPVIEAPTVGGLLYNVAA
jgi:hypothetical protein